MDNVVQLAEYRQQRDNRDAHNGGGRTEFTTLLQLGRSTTDLFPELAERLGESSYEKIAEIALGFLGVHLAQQEAGHKGPYYAPCAHKEAENGKPDRVRTALGTPDLIVPQLPQGLSITPPPEVYQQ